MNKDNIFNSGDLVAIFQADTYEDGDNNNSIWFTGDWTGDADFDSSHLIVAFQAGTFDSNLNATLPVPEPGRATFILGLSATMILRRWSARIAPKVLNLNVNTRVDWTTFQSLEFCLIYRKR